MICGLLENHLIACASIIPEVESIYRWQGEIQSDQETKVILKTSSDYFDKVKDYIKKHCSYEMAEILQVDVTNGNPAYLSWVLEEINPLNASDVGTTNE
ncbi:divalent-cation tolerance protein CutA [Cardinium endosymbiont of Tipula unca]|uniref:divalent-cation tolerance protein CutA n=1 Tax=Cardinium endosymbiont of Tipula unca TaxID=3066216 RepID=UPI0030D5471E